jgi:ATP-dependent DNA helicase RecG
LAELRAWLGRLLEYKLVLSKGKTKGTQYYVNPELLRKLGYKGKTTLKQIETHRLRELILADLKTYPKSSVGEIHERIGKEIPRRKVQQELYQMFEDKLIGKAGVRKHTRYSRSK